MVHTVSRDVACSASAVDPLGSTATEGAEGVTAPSPCQVCGGYGRVRAECGPPYFMIPCWGCSQRQGR